MALQTIPRPQLITTKEAAELLRVEPRTVLNWIKEDRIPYVELPGGGDRRTYRIPLGALLSSLSGTFDLAKEIRDWDRRAVEEGITDEKVLAALEDGD